MKEHILPTLHPDHAAGVTTLERQLSGKLEVAADTPEMAGCGPTIQFEK